MPGIALPEPVTVGNKAPAFTVNSGEKGILSSITLSGKVMVVTYETKDVIDKNKKFKDRVLKFCKTNTDTNSQVVIVPVISCFQYAWPVKGYCAAQVQKNASALKMKLYDDRTGRMFEDFGMQDNESNVLIIDKKGAIRYFKTGRLDEDEIASAIALIKKLESE